MRLTSIADMEPFYDPHKTFEENYNHGPWGPFADGKVYQEAGEPTYDVFGKKVFLPFGVASGPLFNSKFIKAALEKGFDIVTQKTVRSRYWQANTFPNIVPLQVNGALSVEEQKRGVLQADAYEQPLTIVNSFGNPSFDPDVWQPDLKKSLSYVKKGQALICAIEGTADKGGTSEQYIQDWITTARLVKETGIEIIEVNTSCPNEGAADLLCFDVAKTRNILESIRSKIDNIQMTVKLAYFEDKELLKKLVQMVGKTVDGISVINTMPTKVVNQSGELAIPGRPIAGACGDGIRWAGLEMVKYLKQFRDELNLNYKIIGVGGVSKPEHYQMYRELGADIVMAATGVIWNPYLAQEIKKSQR